MSFKEKDFQRIGSSQARSRFPPLTAVHKAVQNTA